MEEAINAARPSHSHRLTSALMLRVEVTRSVTRLFGGCGGDAALITRTLVGGGSEKVWSHAAAGERPSLPRHLKFVFGPPTQKYNVAYSP